MTMNLEIRPYDPTDEERVVRLWKACGLVAPWNDPHRDIMRKLQVQADLFLVGLMGGEVVATAMVGYEGHRGWINYLAVHPDHQRSGLGRVMIDEAESRLRALGCPKINVQVRGTNKDVIDFYRAIGFTEDDVLSLGKRLESDE
jgi:ribosomal protein S18 acetylase RimI-like enzyme